GDQSVERVLVFAQASLHVRDDVLHVTVCLYDELLGDSHRADLDDPADVVSSEVEQHQMLRALLGIGKQPFGERLVFLRSRAAANGAGNRANGDDAVAHAHENLRARSDDGEAWE